MFVPGSLVLHERTRIRNRALDVVTRRYAIAARILASVGECDAAACDKRTIVVSTHACERTPNVTNGDDRAIGCEERAHDLAECGVGSEAR